MKLEALQISSQEQPEGLKPAFFHLKEASAQARDKRAVQEARTARLSHPLLWTGRSCTKSIHRTRFLGTPSEGIWKSGRSWQWIPAPVCQFAMGDSSSWTLHRLISERWGSVDLPLGVYALYSNGRKTAKFLWSFPPPDTLKLLHFYNTGKWKIPVPPWFCLCGRREALGRLSSARHCVTCYLISILLDVHPEKHLANSYFVLSAGLQVTNLDRKPDSPQWSWSSEAGGAWPSIHLSSSCACQLCKAYSASVVQQLRHNSVKMAQYLSTHPRPSQWPLAVLLVKLDLIQIVTGALIFYLKGRFMENN